MQTATVPKLATPPAPRFGAIAKHFYFFMSLLTVVVVFYGFSYTVDKNLIHPPVPKPAILYLHAVVFTSWLGFFVLQSALVRTRNVQWHRRMGWVGLGLGIAVVIVGVSTALVMPRFNREVLHQSNGELFVLVPLFDMLCFAITFGLAIYWRKKPELHRRLMLCATCSLTAAGFFRFPLIPHELFYLGVDALILLGVIRDLMVNRTVHRVYLYTLPLFMIGQFLVIYIIAKQLPFWKELSHKLVG